MKTPRMARESPDFSRGECQVHRVHFNIGALHFHARVAFPRVEIPNIIGRLDVMKAVDVIFRDERQVTLASAT